MVTLKAFLAALEQARERGVGITEKEIGELIFHVDYQSRRNNLLWLIEEARRQGLPHVYLGFWVDNSPKMAYKTRFQPLQAFGADGWTVLPEANKQP